MKYVKKKYTEQQINAQKSQIDRELCRLVNIHGEKNTLAITLGAVEFLKRNSYAN